MKHAIERLELQAVCRALSVRVRTPLGEAQVDAMQPLDTIARAKERIEAIRQTRLLIDKADPPPVWGGLDVEQSLTLGEKGIMLEGAALRSVAHTMHTGSALRRHLLTRETEAPILFGIAAGLPDLARVAREVLQCFDPDGQLSDDASRELGPLRKRVRSLKERIHGKISELLRSSSIAQFLQEDYYTIRADRYVLPIKASFKNEVKGIVHDASGSGQTVYIEPQILVDLGNRLKIAQSEQLEEEHRILSSLTRLVVREAEGVRAMMSAIGRCDFLSAAAFLAQDLEAVPVDPDPQPGFSLIGARHPLLLLQAFEGDADELAEEGHTPVLPRKVREVEVIANDLAMLPIQKILIVTGPNTGGKTVAMKTIGLFALMVRCGLHLPCSEGSKIGWYSRIEAAIGDQQSIASNLSTFAAHMQTLIRILERANDRTLVLIDEVTADTDPTQGAALAQAVLEKLADKGAHAVVTTHFERLKALPFADSRFRNAGVGFDAERLQPTYRVTLDAPQGSSGFDIAQKLGLAEVVVDRARELLGEGASDLERLMKELEVRAAQLERAQARAAEAESEAHRRAEEAERAKEALEKEIVEVREKAREELLDEIAARRDEVNALIATLQKSSDDAAAREAMRLATEARKKLEAIAAEEKKKLEKKAEKNTKHLEEIAVGDWVFVERVGRDGDVVSVSEREVHVVVGNIRMRVPRTTIFKAKSLRPRSTARPDAREFKRAMESIKRGKTEETTHTEELDLRGHGVEESVGRLDGFLDYHYQRPTTHVIIIHGIGTGAVRDAVRDHLKRSGYVKSVRPGGPEEGGDGVTTAVMV